MIKNITQAIALIIERYDALSKSDSINLNLITPLIATNGEITKDAIVEKIFKTSKDSDSAYRSFFPE